MNSIMRIFILTATIAFSSPLEAQSLQFFRGTWQNAQKRAEEENKILYVHAYRNRKGSNIELNDLYMQERISHYFNTNFITYELDMEAMNGKNFGVEYPAYSKLTLFFFSPEGELLRRLEGSQQATAFLNHAKEVYAGYYTLEHYEKRYLQGERDIDLVYKYMKALIDAGLPHEEVANEYLQRKDEISKSERDRFIFTAATTYESQYFDYILQNKKAIIQEVGVERFDEKVGMISLVEASKAMLAEDSALFEKVIQLAKNNLHNDIDLFENKARARYAYFVNDVDNYVKYAKLWSDSSKDNALDLDEIIYGLNAQFDNNREAMQLGAKLVRLRLKQSDPSGYSVGLYAKVLTLGNKKKQALELIEKLRFKKINHKLKVYLLDGVERYIDNLEPLQA